MAPRISRPTGCPTASASSSLPTSATRRIPAGFDLYLINEDGTGLERITTYPGFDAFPMFSSDGKRLVWASNRNGTAPHETNIFIADWVE